VKRHVYSSIRADLGPRAGKVRAKHDDPRSLIGELLGARLEAILKKLEVAATTVSALLILDFILKNQRLVLEVERSF